MTAIRDQQVTDLLRWFEYTHLPQHLQPVSATFHVMAHAAVESLPDSFELVAGLRKLLEAKDCIVRAAVDAHRAQQ